MGNRVKLWFYMCLFEAGRFRAYPHEIAAGIFARLAEVILFGTFWLVVSQVTGAGIDARDIIGYYLIISGLTPFFYAGFGIGGLTNDMIKSGELNQSLIRPISPILHPWAIRTGRNAINIAFGFLQITIGILLTGGLQAEIVPMLVPVILNTAALNAAFNIFLGAMGFYLTDGRNFKNAFLHFATFMRGDRMPIYLMEPGFAHFLMLTPFPASMYHLTMLLHGSYLPSWGDVLIGSAWAVTLLF
ncbi:MAG TPA: hypothetical protein VM581_03975, partial [Magnetospirillaceae bacterium]|nr:hypothetical protein [Magnetospirillaceae bacterium]